MECLFSAQSYPKTSGCVSGVAVSSSLYILIDLSHSAVIILRELRSNLMSNIPASHESEPGCTCVFIYWKLCPLCQSKNCSEPLSAPLTNTLSVFKARELTTALCSGIVRN